MTPNRRERRRRNLNKQGMSDAEFQAFMAVEREKMALVFRPKRIVQAVLFAVRYPERSLAA